MAVTATSVERTAATVPSRGRLLQVLGVAFGIAIIVGNTIGSGILRTPSSVAGLLPSRGMFLLAWVAGGVYALLGVMSLAELGVIANVTPLWARLEASVAQMTLPFVSARSAACMYPFGSIVRAGGALAFGSDWAVSTPDPRRQLAVAVSRRDPLGSSRETFLPEERLDLGTAIAAHTIGAAYACGIDAVTGSIEPGKLADLAVLDRDLFATEPEEYPDVRVLATLVEGEIVHAEPGTGLA